MAKQSLKTSSRGDFRNPHSAAQAFSRAAGAPLVHETASGFQEVVKTILHGLMRLTQRKTIYFENYIIHDDKSPAICRRVYCQAREVQVRVLYDWMDHSGSIRRLLRRLSDGGVEVRCFTPAPDSPLGG